MPSSEELIQLLRKLSLSYCGIQRQGEIYQTTLEKLREMYKDPKNNISEAAIEEINSLKRNIENGIKNLHFHRNRPTEMKDGVVVMHTEEFYVGVVSGTTKMKRLFEIESDDSEFRVRVGKKTIRIASPRNLEIIGTAYVNRCYQCKGYVGFSLEKCGKCQWYICLECGSCGCQYDSNKSVLP